MRIDVHVSRYIDPCGIGQKILAPYILAEYCAEVDGIPYECRIAFDRETPYQQIREMGDPLAISALEKALAAQ